MGADKDLVDLEALQRAGEIFDRWLAEVFIEAAIVERERVSKVLREIESVQRMGHPSAKRLNNLQWELEHAQDEVSERCRKEALRVPTLLIACDEEGHIGHRVMQVGVA